MIYLTSRKLHVMFYYREYPANAPLSVYIKKFWVLDNSRQATAMSNKNILPNGCTNLAFISGEGISIKTKQDEIYLSAGIYLVGQLRSSIQVCIRPYTKITLVQLYPWTAGQLLSTSLEDTAGNFISLGDIDALLYQQLQQLPLDAEVQIVAFFEGALLRMLGNAGRRDILQPACRLIRAHRGSLGIHAIGVQLGCSTRYLEKQFRRHLGITPKDYAGIIRVRSLVDALSHLPDPARMTQLALEYGFYDQAHFIKTFGTIVQMAPGKFQLSDFLLQNAGEGY